MCRLPTPALEDVRIDVRLKISALWIALLFLFAYGDIFGFFRPGIIEEVIAGEISGIQITQIFLLGVSVYIAIASLMVFLTLVLKPRVSRWTNIVLPILYIVSIGLGYRRIVGVLLLLEHRGKRAPAADHPVRMDVAQTSGKSRLKLLAREDSKGGRMIWRPPTPRR